MKDKTIVCNMDTSTTKSTWLGSTQPATRRTPQAWWTCAPLMARTSSFWRRVVWSARLCHRSPKLRDVCVVHQRTITNRALEQPGQVREQRVHLARLGRDTRLHLAKIGVEIDELSNEQADYIGVPVQGPFKGEAYRCCSKSQALEALLNNPASPAGLFRFNCKCSEWSRSAWSGSDARATWRGHSRRCRPGLATGSWNTRWCRP